MLFLSSSSSVGQGFMDEIIGFILCTKAQEEHNRLHRKSDKLNRKEKARALPQRTTLYSREIHKTDKR